MRTLLTDLDGRPPRLFATIRKWLPRVTNTEATEITERSGCNDFLVLYTPSSSVPSAVLVENISSCLSIMAPLAPT